MPAESDRKLLEQGWIEEWRTRYRETLNSSVAEDFQPFEPSHPHFREEYVLHCPCCSTKVQVLDQVHLLELQRKWSVAHDVLDKIYRRRYPHYTYRFQNPIKLFQVYTQNFQRHNRQIPMYGMWTCDTCILSGKAEIADFENAFTINHSGGSAPYFYFDYDIECEACQKNFTYTKGQQRWAYETFVISANSNLQECPECRREKHRLKNLQQLVHLSRTDPEPFEHLHKASQLMLKYNDPRSLEYLRRAKNKAPNFELKQILERQISELLAQ
jgi:hypothetical protein